MKLWKLIAVVLLVLALLLGCAKKAEEAARLEQEMLEQQQAANDTVQDEVVVTGGDSVADEVADATAIPEEEKPVQMEAPTGDGFTIQVSACENRDYAQHLIDLFKTRGYEPYMTTTVLDGQSYYRVRIGGVATLTEAKTLQAEIADKYSLEPWIDTL